MFEQSGESKEENTLGRRNNSDTSEDKARGILLAQSSVASTTSVFSRTSADRVSTLSKSSTGSAASLDGDEG